MERQSVDVDMFFSFFDTATALLDRLISYLTTSERSNCKAVYLHVLATNITAIRFYEKHNFRKHEYLPYYYAIRGQPKDGLSYVLYINGGQPPWTLIYPFIETILFTKISRNISEFYDLIFFFKLGKVSRTFSKCRSQ